MNCFDNFPPILIPLVIIVLVLIWAMNFVKIPKWMWDTQTGIENKLRSVKERMVVPKKTSTPKPMSKSDKRTVDYCMIAGLGLMGYGTLNMLLTKDYGMMYMVGGLSLFLITLYWNTGDEDG